MVLNAIENTLFAKKGRRHKNCKKYKYKICVIIYRVICTFTIRFAELTILSTKSSVKPDFEKRI